MLVTPMYKGQGLGNQLANYVTTRTLALDKGYDFGVAFPENFKGKSFMNLDMGKEVIGLEVPVEGKPPTKLPKNMLYYEEKGEILVDGSDIRGYDERIREIGDNTCIHGLLQGEDYFKHRKDEIREWLMVEPMEMSDDLCVINFRGGEYVGVKDFFLSSDYWSNALKNILLENPDMSFEVHTDDKETASKFFPQYNIIQDIEFNWRAVRYAKYLILSNSSFGWFPAWLNTDVKKIIAPKWWNRFNRGYWSLEQNKTKGFWYQDYFGNLEQL